MADNTAELRAPLADDVPVAASQLSALVDDELADREIDLVLRRLSRDDDARHRWERYHLISDAVQGQLPAALDTEFAARIRQAIEAEPLPQTTARPLPAWYKPVTGFGLAASVALVALFGLKLNQTEVLQPATPLAATTSTPFTAAAALPIQTAAITRLADPAREPVEARLSHYLVNHNGYASMNSVNGMLPYVRMVGYQPQPGR